VEFAVQDLTLRHAAAGTSAPAVVQDLSLRIASGEQLALIGPSGAGKTSLLMALACAMRPLEGQVLIDGADPWRLSQAKLRALRGRLFMAPQSPPLPPRQRVATALLAAQLPALSAWASLRAWVHPTQPQLQAALAALQGFDLADKLFERVDRLSGGERQRVGLARALLAPAQAWLVDEPLSALDPARARQSLQTLQVRARERGLSLVVSLHQVEVARACFPRIVGLRAGRLLFDLPAEQVSDQHLAELYRQVHSEAWTPTPAAGPVPAAIDLVCR